MARHKGMSKKMVLTRADNDELAALFDRLKRLQGDMHPLANVTPALSAATATLAATREALGSDTDWLGTSGADKGNIGPAGLSELEAIWTAVARLEGALGARSPSKHPLHVATLTLKAALAECSGDAQAWSISPIDLSQTLARRRGRCVEPTGPMFQGFGQRHRPADSTDT